MKKITSLNYIPTLPFKIGSWIIDFFTIYFPLYFISLHILPANKLFEEAVFLKELTLTSNITLNLSFSLILLLCWIFLKGQSPGKKLLSMKIVDFKKKDSPMLIQYLIRFSIISVYMIMPITFFISMFLIFFRDDRRTIHDILSSTQVIYAEESAIE